MDPKNHPSKWYAPLLPHYNLQHWATTIPISWTLQSALVIKMLCVVFNQSTFFVSLTLNALKIFLWVFFLCHQHIESNQLLSRFCDESYSKTERLSFQIFITINYYNSVSQYQKNFCTIWHLLCNILFTYGEWC